MLDIFFTRNGIHLGTAFAIDLDANDKGNTSLLQNLRTKNSSDLRDDVEMAFYAKGVTGEDLQDPNAVILFAAAGLHVPDEKIQFVFNPSEFVFNVSALARTLVGNEKLTISSEMMDLNRQTLPAMIRSYLINAGFYETFHHVLLSSMCTYIFLRS